MLRETSQLLPNTKLSPYVLNTWPDWPTRRMKKYTIRMRMSAASALSPHFMTRSGRRPADDRSRTERPPVGVVLVAANLRSYEIGDPLQTIVASCVLSLSASDEGSGA